MDRARLIQAGIDYDEGVERFGGDPAIYEKYLSRFLSGGYTEQIVRELEADDIQAAFRTTHDLKALAGNLSLSCFYQAVCALTETLRPQDPGVDYSDELARVMLCYERAKLAAKEDEQ